MRHKYRVMGVLAPRPRPSLAAAAVLAAGLCALWLAGLALAVALL